MSKAKLRADAINRFIVDAKSLGVYDALRASCVMAGWDSLAGALTPLAGTAPSNNGFLAADYDRGTGLKGNGSSKYLNSNRANNADGQNDNHNAVFVSHIGPGVLMASGGTPAGLNWIDLTGIPHTPAARFFSRSNTAFQQVSAELQTGLYAQSRAASSAFRYFCPQDANEKTSTSQTPNSANQIVFAYTNDGVSFASFSTSTISFYSIGSSLGPDPATGLSVLDTLVSRLLADFRSIDEDGMDRDALAYIRNVEAADGGYLELGVKKAIETFVRGCKYDGIWDSIKAACILCGARTLAGALVPLAGVAPSNNNFVDADYNRETGLVGNGSTKWLTQQNLATPLQDSAHQSIFLTTHSSAVIQTHIAESPASGTNGLTQISLAGGGVFMRSREGTGSSIAGNPAGLLGSSRSSPANYVRRQAGINTTISAASTGVPSQTIVIFSTTGFSQVSSSRLAFYSIGESISDLALLDARVTALVTSIGAAL